MVPGDLFLCQNFNTTLLQKLVCDENFSQANKGWFTVLLTQVYMSYNVYTEAFS